MLIVLIQCVFSGPVIFKVPIWAMQFAASALVQTTTYQLGTTHQTHRDVAPTCFYQGFPGSWKFFLEGCRASHHRSKQPPLCCLFESHAIHKYLINTELYLNFAKYGDQLLVVKSLANILKYACWFIKAYGNGIKIV